MTGMLAVTIMVATVLPRLPSAPRDSTPPSKGQSRSALALLCTVPMALGSYNTAVQLAGDLNNQQVMLLQLGTYAVAGAGLTCYRLMKEGRVIHVGRRTWRAGIELGLWLFAGATLQALGLQRTTASRAGFLVSLSTAIVPLVESLVERRLPSLNVVAAATCCTLGTALFMLPQSNSAVARGVVPVTWQGDSLVVLSALFYSGHILRLSSHAWQHVPVELATAKATTQMVATSIVCVALAARHSLCPLPLAALPCMLYTGLVTCLYVQIAQAYGQAKVCEARTQMAVRPICIT